MIVGNSKVGHGNEKAKEHAWKRKVFPQGAPLPCVANAKKKKVLIELLLFANTRGMT